MPASQALMDKIRTLYPWMTAGLLSTYETSWGEYEDSDLALQEVRLTDEYQAIFRGNYDPESGQVRMTESNYFASKAKFDATLISVGLNPDPFEDEWIRALEGDVSPTEMTGRIESAYERIIEWAPEIRQFYSDTYGIDMTDAAIVGSVLSPRIGEELISKQMTMAEIGGEAATRGFNIGKDLAEELYNRQLGRSDAAGFFGSAANQLPVLDVLAKRHDDPDDDFDLEEFVTAGIYDDPTQRRRIRRLVAQEGSMFTSGKVARERSTGALTGLTEQ